jgi:hypothetical protein
MFDPCHYKTDLYMQSELDPNPSNSNKLGVWTNMLL